MPPFAQPTPPRPHIFLVVVDDLGWGNVGYHRRRKTGEVDQEVRTPTMDRLARAGVELNRHYAHMFCTPSRASLQTGRLPVHVLTRLVHPCDSHGAVPRNMTGLAAKLRTAGYATHQVGKWDVGMTTPLHTPRGRGYDTSLTFFGHGNWMWSEAEWAPAAVRRGERAQGSQRRRPRPEAGAAAGSAAAPLPSVRPPGPLPPARPLERPLERPLVDLWDTDRPASRLNGTGYEEDLFRGRMLSILSSHDPATPLFLNYDSRVAHYPLQAPRNRHAPTSYQRLPHIAAIGDDNRRVYQAMVSYLDDQLDNITGTMASLGLWERTLMVLTSDNGGFVKSPDGGCETSFSSSVTSVESAWSDLGHGASCSRGEAGASNWPLRGGKYSAFEGGIRVAAFVSGGFVPPAVRGTRLEGIVHVADWYGTLCRLAGVDPTDRWAAASGLPPVDSLDVWPMISGANLTSPRVSFLVTRDVLVRGRWKYVRGGSTMVGAAWGGPRYPNGTSGADPIHGRSLTCPERGCLFNVVADAEERRELSARHPGEARRLGAELDALGKTAWATAHAEDPRCRETASSRWGGFLGPWREVGLGS